MLEILQNIDSRLLLLFNGVHSPFFDEFMMCFTQRYVWVPMYAMLFVAVLMRFGARRGVLVTAFVLLSIVLADQTCAHLIRPLVERMRPSNPDNPLSAAVHIVDGYRGGRYGFPSCHAANSFALAMVISLVFRQKSLGWFLFVWAAVNSYSRLYLGVHYPGDLLCGAAIGILCAALSYGLLRLLPLRRARTPRSRLPGRCVIAVGLIEVAAIAIYSLVCLVG